MTPYNLVNMAKLFGLDIIALTDHNSALNCAAAMKAGQAAGLVVVPGMELCTAEEIHVICLFPTLAAAEAFGEHVHSMLPPIKNKPDVYGHQVIMDHLDGSLGEEQTLLVTGSSIPITDVPGVVKWHGGVCYPAHIDRSSYSVLSVLGTLSHDMGFTCAEVRPTASLEALTAIHPDLSSMRIMRSSDAHYLQSMREAADAIELTELTAKAVITALSAHK
jgi:hypothetical protein